MAKASSPLDELSRLARAAKRIEFDSHFDLDPGETLHVEMHRENGVDGGKVWFGYWVMTYDKLISDRSNCGSHRPKFSAAMHEVASLFPTATLRPESVKVSLREGGLSPVKARRLAVQAWHEAFGRTVPSIEEVATWEKEARQRMSDEAQAIVAKLKTGQGGVKAYNELDWGKQEKVDLRNQDFSGCDLRGLCLNSSKAVDGARFVGACLAEAGMHGCDGRGADFSRCDLTGTVLERAKLQNAAFQGAVLNGTRLSAAHLEGADFTRATIEDCRWSASTRFDEHTVWPQGFTPPAVLKWEGKGPDPRLGPSAGSDLATGSKPFATFLKHLQEAADRGKLERAFSMLREDRFQLFAETTEEHLSGIVKSQTDASLIYGCRLKRDGSYACCTQNLNPCGGLRGSPCKHLLVLIVGLVKAGALEPRLARTWLKAARGKKAALDKDAMTGLFLRYKGAEAGEIDWRPTETIPEDFYAM
jgi:hypothetical protein